MSDLESRITRLEQLLAVGDGTPDDIFQPTFTKNELIALLLRSAQYYNRGRPRTYTTIGKALGVTASRAREIEHRAWSKIQIALRDDLPAIDERLAP